MKGKDLPKVIHETDQVMIQMARMLSSMIERRDAALKDHCVRVANNCANFCQTLKSAGEQEVEAIFIAGLLHDIGLVFLPLSVLQKPEALTEEENALVKTHPVVGESILCHLTGLSDILPIIRHHHEAFDGSGYPDGLAGDEIPYGARLLRLADSYDALVFPRSDSTGLSMQEAFAEIKTKSGSQFDGDLAKKFVQFLKSNTAEAEGWLEKKDKSSIQQIFKEIIKNFRVGKFDAPVMPQIVHQVQNVIKNATSSIDDVVRVVEKDAVLALRLISVANSPVYRGVHKINSLKYAIPRIGLKETHNIIIAISVKSLYETKWVHFKNLMDDLWHHSLACAYGAKMIARQLKLDDPEKYFLMGLIHDIGKTLLLRSFSDVSQSKTLSIDLVKANIQEAHLRLGAGLLKRWGFGDDFIQVILRHEDTEFNPKTSKEILVTHLANVLTRKTGYSFFDDEIDFAELGSAKLLEIDPKAFDGISEAVKSTVDELKNVIQ